MKKLALGILSATFILGASTAVFAAEKGDGAFNFGQMKPHMQKMHPEMSNQELKDMYESCHGTNGAMPSKNFEEMNHEEMMNHF